MKLLRGVIVLVLAFSLTACSDYDQLRDMVAAENRAVDMALTNYEKSKKYGSPVADLVLECLKLNDIKPISEEKNIGNALPKELLVEVKRLSEAYTLYLEEEELKDNATPINRADLVESTLTVRYFLDDSTGKVEQLFFVQLPNGYVGGFTLSWLGGIYLDSKTVS